MKLQLFSLFLFLGVLGFAQYTYIPDDKFEQELIFWGHDDVLDGKVLTENIESLTFLNVSGRGIQDLTGIEDFKSLEHFECVYNLLTEVNLSLNTKLKNLYLDNNLFTSLSLPENVNLEVLSCSFNNLQNIDVSENINLVELNCFNNNLNLIDVSNNLNLTSLNCAMNNLTELDVSNNSLLKGIDFHTNFITDLDFSNNLELEFITGYRNQVLELDLSKLISLKSLIFNENRLTNLDLSNNNEMYELAVVLNNLQTLKLGTGIQGIYCRENKITNLDLRHCPEITILDCRSNDLTQLNIQNGANEIMVFFAADGNENLNCIQVDNAAWSETNWLNVDEWSTFSENCLMVTNEQDFSSFQIFPNPTKNVLNFSQELKEFTIYDLSGKLILKGKGNQINVSNLPNGTYLMKGITTSGKSINQKFIKN